MKIRLSWTLAVFFLYVPVLFADYPASNSIQIGSKAWPWVVSAKSPLWIQPANKTSIPKQAIFTIQFRSLTGTNVFQFNQTLSKPDPHFFETPVIAPDAPGLYQADFTLGFQGKVLAQGAHRFAVLAPQENAASGFGSCVISDFKFDRRGTDIPELALMTGTTWNRPIIEWKSIEKKKGDRDWKTIDQMIQSRTQAGLNLAPLVAVTPGWQAGHQNAPAQDLQAYGQFVFDLVTRYKDRVHVWGFANEVNHGKQNPGWTPQIAAQHLRTAYEAAKKADPTCQVLFPGIAFVDLGFIDGMYRAGAKNFFDIMNVHPYGYPVAPEESKASFMDPNASFHAVENLRALMQRYGDGEKPIWFTEYAWNDGKQLPPDQQHRPFNLLVNSDLEQAQFVVRGALLAATWKVERIFLLNFVDYHQEVKMPFSRTGLITKDLTPKLSLVSWAAMTSVLKGTTYQGVQPLSNPSQHAVKFKKGNQTVWAVWDSQKESALQLPAPVGDIQVVDFWGNVSSFHNDGPQLMLRIGPNVRYVMWQEMPAV